jgi:hypothetical protein
MSSWTPTHSIGLSGRLSGRCASKMLLIIPFLVSCWADVAFVAEAAESEIANVFLQFTGHIAHQVQIDKQQFAAAEVCTYWFYQQLKPKPSNPHVQPTSHTTRASDAENCRTKYPQGIDGARDEWSRTQSSLSLSLTFYEFALVGDADDDGQYSDAELRDILEAFGLTLETPMPEPVMLATLNNKFDTVRKFGGLEMLMASMETLHDKGYRFTSQDREALSRIMG